MQQNGLPINSQGIPRGLLDRQYRTFGLDASPKKTAIFSIVIFRSP